MTDKQINQAAEEYVNNNPFYHPYTVIATRESFKDGIIYALSHQWVSVDERLPEDDVLVVVWIENSAILADFCEKGKWHYYGVRYWLPIPPLNPEKK